MEFLRIVRRDLSDGGVLDLDLLKLDVVELSNWGRVLPTAEQYERELAKLNLLLYGCACPLRATDPQHP